MACVENSRLKPRKIGLCLSKTLPITALFSIQTCLFVAAMYPVRGAPAASGLYPLHGAEWSQRKVGFAARREPPRPGSVAEPTLQWLR